MITVKILKNENQMLKEKDFIIKVSKIYSTKPEYLCYLTYFLENFYKTHKNNFIVIAKENDNIFKTEEGQDLLNKKGNVFQNDIFASDIAKYGGIKYAKDGDDIAESALNFAKADAYAIGKANQIANGADANDSIDSYEVRSYKDFTGNLKDTFEEMNIAGSDKSLSPEEYASYLIAVDGLVQNENGAEFDAQKIDGLITPQEALTAKNLDNKQLQDLAQKIYEENF